MMTEIEKSVPASCRCWMLRDQPPGAVCRSFEPDSESVLIAGDEGTVVATCVHCLHAEVCHEEAAS